MKNILLVIFLFTIGIFIGIFLPDETLLEQVISNLEQIIENGNVFWRIWFQNSAIALILLFGGYLFAIPTVHLIVINGYILGLVVNYFVKLDGITVILTLIPHGIFELFAFGYAASIGFEKSVALFEKTPKRNLLKTAILLVVILLIAALIETFLL